MSGGGLYRLRVAQRYYIQFHASHPLQLICLRVMWRLTTGEARAWFVGQIGIESMMLIFDFKLKCHMNVFSVSLNSQVSPIHFDLWRTLWHDAIVTDHALHIVYGGKSGLVVQIVRCTDCIIRYVNPLGVTEGAFISPPPPPHPSLQSQGSAALKACSLMSDRQLQTQFYTSPSFLSFFWLPGHPFIFLSSSIFLYSSLQHHHPRLLFHFSVSHFLFLSPQPPLSLALLTLSPPPSPSHSGTRLSDMAVNRIALTQSEFSVRGHLFQAIVESW